MVTTATPLIASSSPPPAPFRAPAELERLQSENATLRDDRRCYEAAAVHFSQRLLMVRPPAAEEEEEAAERRLCIP